MQSKENSHDLQTKPHHQHDYTLEKCRTFVIFQRTNVEEKANEKIHLDIVNNSLYHAEL